MFKILGNLFDSNEREVNKLRPLVELTNSFEADFKKLSDSKLKDVTTDFRKRLEKGETQDELLPEAFAAVREAARRTIGQRHFDVQIMGGVVLHEGKIAEMRTGEGKALVATLPLYLNALTEKGVHLVTVHDYLAKRDAEWMGPIYHALGLSVGVINHESAFVFDPHVKKEDEELKMDPKESLSPEQEGLGIGKFLRPVSRKKAYLADITYGTNHEFGFDYLRDNMVADIHDMVQRNLNFAIVDEVDSILIDEARTPLIISQAAEESTEKYYDFAKIIEKLTSQTDYVVDEKLKTANLTEIGISTIERLTGVSNLYEMDVIVIPTNKPSVREDLPDSVYKNEHGKYEALIEDIDSRHKKGQPVLVGTTSIEKNELLGDLLKRKGVPHQLLNAKNHLKEAQIIASAGQKGAVTMATNIAGRGVDIKLGEGVANLGGLHVIGSERHEARRIDNQLRGRSGRQGDSGSTKFYVSL